MSDDTEETQNTAAAVVKTRKERGPTSRWYIDGNNWLVCKVKGEPDEIQSLTSMDRAAWHRMAQEGYVACRHRGFTHSDIMSGKALPDRTAPPVKTVVVKAGKPTRANIWVRAVATDIANQMVKAHGGSVPKDAIAQMWADAVAVAKGLSKADLALRKKSKSVLHAYADLVGEDASAKPSISEAAD